MPTLEFKGKNHIYAHHLTVPYRPLQVDVDRSILPDTQGDSIPLTDQNLIIHGDNLYALKALLPHYAGRVKCIYIDPPYNTGNEGWGYNDNVNNPMMQAWFEKNKPVDGEDLERHDKWLCMMWPRLHLLRELLRNDGAIFISIDDNEVHHLRMLMDEIFGEENFVANVIWEKKYSPQNDAKWFSDNHDHVVVYGRNKQEWKRNLLPRTDVANARYTNRDNDPRGRWKSSGLDVRTYMPEYDYEITTPSGRVVNPPKGTCWRVPKEKFEEMVAENRIWFGKHGNNVPSIKRFLADVRDGITPLTIWTRGEVGDNQSARRMIRTIFGDTGAFETPKSVDLIKRMIHLATDDRSENIVLDSFAGSGTTAHAGLALNKEDGGNRRFILVECEDYADSITAERVRRVIRGVPNAKDKALKEGLGGSFAYCTLGDPIDIDSLLTGDDLPAFTDLASYLLHTATGISASPQDLHASGADGHFYSDGERDYYLIYEPSRDFLRDSEAALNLERAERIREKRRRRWSSRRRNTLDSANSATGISPSANCLMNWASGVDRGTQGLSNQSAGNL